MLSDNRACAVARLTATVPQPGWHGTVWGGQQACHAAQKPHEQARSLGVLEQVRTHGSKLEMSRSTIRICSNGYTATVLQPCCNRSSTGPNSTGFASELECRKPLS